MSSMPYGQRAHQHGMIAGVRGCDCGMLEREGTEKGERERGTLRQGLGVAGGSPAGGCS